MYLIFPYLSEWSFCFVCANLVLTIMLSGNWGHTMTNWTAGLALLVLLIGSDAGLAGASNGWAVWFHNQSSPGVVTVAPVGTLTAPWQVDSIWGNNARDAWKKACWLTKQGDLYGRNYSAPAMDQGRVYCDQSCNCRF